MKKKPIINLWINLLYRLNIFRYLLKNLKEVNICGSISSKFELNETLKSKIFLINKEFFIGRSRSITLIIPIFIKKLVKILKS